MNKITTFQKQKNSSYKQFHTVITVYGNSGLKYKNHRIFMLEVNLIHPQRK